MEEVDDVCERETVSLSDLTNVFTDTCILLNYVQRGVERDYTSDLIDGDEIGIVVGVTAADELEDVSNRRGHIYADFVDFLLSEDGEIGDYDLDSRRPYFQPNDHGHVRNIQMRLSQLDERSEIQRQLRHFIRAAKRRVEYLLEEIIPKSKFELQPGLDTIFAIGDVVSNNKDRNVVGDAALWAAEESGSSGVFVTMDKSDLLNLSDEINAVLRSEKDETWQLVFLSPIDLPLDSEATASSS